MNKEDNPCYGDCAYCKHFAVPDKEPPCKDCIWMDYKGNWEDEDNWEGEE